VSLAEARRIAVRAQLLDGSATSVLETVRRLGFLQIDPISTVAPPQQLVLWSRLGPHDRDKLDRLLWKERKLFEWRAFIWPIEDLPLLCARMRRRRGNWAWDRRSAEFLQTNARFRRFVMRELERRGPMLSRELADDSVRTWKSHGWWGNRNVAVMLELLERRGVVAVAGRRGGQRLWDLAERLYPATETVPLTEAERMLADKRFRTLGVRFEKGEWRAHPDPCDGPGVRPDDVPLAVRPPDPRPRPGRGAVRLPLPARGVRAQGKARVRLLRPPHPPRRPRRRSHRAGFREEDTHAACPRRMVGGGRAPCLARPAPAQPRALSRRS
jgi:hypothetical protein